MTAWIVLADQREALVYELGEPGGRFKLVHKAENPASRPDRELESDRPGRTFSSGNRQRHALGGERSARRTYQAAFAKHVAEEIERGRKLQRFDRLALIAEPRMLGLLRKSLSDASRARIADEVPKDLLRFDETAIREHLAPAALRPRPG
jgi:protein required for attachment to host cells